MRLFDFWKKPAEQDLTKEKISPRPGRTEKLGGYASAPVLKGAFTGGAQDLNLASGFVYPAIAIPARLAGVPILPEGYGDLQTYLFDEGSLINRVALVTGTAWRWPRWSDKLRRLVWEVIPDGAIGSQGIQMDPDTGEILAIRTDQMIEYYRGEDQVRYARRVRVINKETVTEEWTGDKRELRQYRNPFGYLPIPFGHDCWEGEWRGQSVYGRLIRLIKDSHDIRRNRDEILAQDKPKMIQTTASPAEWAKNNKLYTSQGANEHYSPFEADFVLNKGDEKTEYLNIGADATAQHTAAIEDNKKETIIASGLPEIFFGQVATGNAASTDSQIVMGVEYIRSVRQEFTRPYKLLLNQSTAIDAYMRFAQALPIDDINWDELSMTSAEAKARILSSYAGAMSAMLSNGSVSKEGALYFTRMLYPDYPVDDAAVFLNGINEMMTEHSSRIGQQLMDAGDFAAGGQDY
jgi:hypothetical protein